MFASLVVTVLNRFLPLLGGVVKENKTPNNELTEQSFGSTKQEELVMGNMSPDDTTVETQQSLTLQRTQQWTPTNPEVFADNMAQLEKVLAPLRKVWEDAPTNEWVSVTHRCFPFQKYVARYKDNGCELHYLQNALKEDLNELFTLRWQHPKGLRHGAKTKGLLLKVPITEEQLELNLQELEEQENPASSNETAFERDWQKQQENIAEAERVKRRENDAANRIEAERVKRIADRKAAILGELEDNESLVTTLLERRESLQKRIAKLRIEGYSLEGKLRTVLARESGTTGHLGTHKKRVNKAERKTVLAKEAVDAAYLADDTCKGTAMQQLEDATCEYSKDEAEWFAEDNGDK